MGNIRLEITEKDIKEYLNTYKDYYKYCGPLFIKYLKDNQGILTEEIFEILTKGNVSFDNRGELPSFDSDPTAIQNLDLSGICHILIPTIKYYGRSEISFDQLYGKLVNVASMISIPVNHPLNAVESTLDDYIICGKVVSERRNKTHMINIKMGRKHCMGELLAYQSFYDEDKVKVIKKIVREGMK